MSTPRTDNGSDGQANTLLGALPRTRPQRASKRRQAARAAESASAAASESATATAKGRPVPSATRRQGPSQIRGQIRPPVPPQGYEAEPDSADSASVTPPSGQELLSSFAELAGELVHSGLSRGAQLLKDALPGL